MVKHKHGDGSSSKAAHGDATAVVPGKTTLTQGLGMAQSAGPDPILAMYQDDASRLSQAGHHLQQDVSRWNVGLGVLSSGMVRAAGEQAMTDFLTVMQNANALVGSPMADAAHNALVSARELVAQLGLFHFMDQPITARPVAIDDAGALPYIQRSIERAERCIADALRLFDLCGGGKTAGVALDPTARMEAAALIDKHAENDEEARWLDAFTKATNIRHTLVSMGSDSQAELLVMRTMQVQADEQYFANKQNGRDFDAAEMAALDDDAAQIEDFIAKEAFGWRTVEVLQKYPPEKRLYLVQLLNHRHQLENMVHRAGMGYGDKIQALIRECPALGQWEYDYSKVTVKSTSDKIGDSVTEMVDELPGAALEFAGGVYHEMGHLPAIGPVFERAGKSFDDLAAVTDDAIGVNKDDIKVRNEVAGATGHAVGAVGISAAGGELAEAKRAYDTGSAVDQAIGFVAQVKSGFDAADEKWETVTGIFSELAAGEVELATDSLAGDRDKWKHVIGHLDGMLDLAIEKLGAMEGAALGGDAGKEEKKRDDRMAKMHDQAVDQAGEDAMSPQLKAAHAAAERSARLAKNPQGTPASRGRAAAQLKKDAATVKDLGEQEALTIASARAKADQEEDKKDSQARAIDADMKKAADRTGYYKEQLGDVVKEMIVGFTVGALKGAKEELRAAAERLADGKAADLDGRQILIKALTKGATNAIIDVVEPRVKKRLVKFFEKAIGDLLAQIDEELRGAATLAESAIQEAVDWGIEQIGAEEWLEEKIGGLVESAFGGNESLAPGVSAE